MAFIIVHNSGLSETRYLMLLQQAAQSDSPGTTPASLHRNGLREVLQGAFGEFWKGQHMHGERPNLVVTIPTDGDDIEEAAMPWGRAVSRFYREQPVVLIVEVGFPILRMSPEALGNKLAVAVQDFFSATLKQRRPVEVYVRDGERQAASSLPMPSLPDR